MVLIDFKYINDKIIHGVPDLTINDYQKLNYFIEHLFNNKIIKDFAEKFEDMDANYNIASDRITMSLKFGIIHLRDG